MSDRLKFFQELNSFFDHIYVITLERATERQEHIKKELAGLNYQFFYGKDKMLFDIEEVKEKGVYDEDAAKKNHRYNKTFTTGQIACSWSHANVYRDVIEKNYNKVFIFEDDVVIDEKQIHIFSSLITQLPADWEVLYFGFAEREKAPPFSILKKGFYHLLRLLGHKQFSRKTINHLYPRKISDHIKKAGYHDCIHAYALRGEAAKKLLQLQQPISHVADNLLAYACTNEIVKGYVIWPKLINQQYQVGISSASYINE